MGIFCKFVGVSNKSCKRFLFISSSFLRVQSLHNVNLESIKAYMSCKIQSASSLLSTNVFITSPRMISVSSVTWQNKKNAMDEHNNESDDLELRELFSQVHHVPSAGHKVLVIQPYVKWGPAKRRNTTPELQLNEATALISSLPKWDVVDKVTVPLRSLDKKGLFGSGSLEQLKQKVTKNKQITAVFISIDTLQSQQVKDLEAMFGVSIYDRYMIVMQIFRMRAVSKAAKLQVALAEIPYLWSRFKDIPGGTAERGSGGGSSVSGTGESFLEVRKRLLREREFKLKQQLEKVRSHRELLRNNRQRQKYPSVAVVGYTNAGKTSLIQSLTGDDSLHPRDTLFATLDVTHHVGLLPCKLKVLYVDTVGFISDIPTTLIESFVATLEDAMLADVIVHVQDLSNPDSKAQAEHVTATLHSLHLPENLINNIIVAGNKVDLLPAESLDIGSDIIAVSAVHNTGLSELRRAIEKAVLQATGRLSMVIRVPMGGEEASWLYKEVAVTEASPHAEDNQYMLMRVVITPAQLAKFRHRFIK